MYGVAQNRPCEVGLKMLDLCIILCEVIKCLFGCQCHSFAETEVIVDHSSFHRYKRLAYRFSFSLDLTVNNTFSISVSNPFQIDCALVLEVSYTDLIWSIKDVSMPLMM